MHARWTADAAFLKLFPADYCGFFQSHLTSSAPVAVFPDNGGNNVLAFAFSELSRKVTFSAGLREETNCMDAEVHLFTAPEAPLAEYDAALRIDARKCYFGEVLASLREWLEAENDVKPMSVPDAARRPWYSTWYSFHQKITPEELLTECRLAKEYNMTGIIVDDGWQTGDNQRGYAWCGDWHPAATKLPDPAEFVREVHNLGLKALLWYSVPFVGKFSAAYQSLAKKTLDFSERLGAGTLDPRFPEVREALVKLYQTALQDWHLDGLKLDFIDRFQLGSADPAAAENYAGRDLKSVPLATRKLLNEVSESLQKIKPDVLLEFRQNYVGPAVRQFGNMFRAADCPGDALSNRIRTLDLRLFSGNTAVHSDMLTWHLDAPAEVAGLQLWNTLFAVPQISVRLEKLSPEHQKMLRFYLDFWLKHRDTLLDGKLRAEHMEHNYTRADATGFGEHITALFADASCVEIDRTAQRHYIVNAGCAAVHAIVLNGGTAEFTIRNVLGETLASGTMSTGVQTIRMPSCGNLKIKL